VGRLGHHGGQGRQASVGSMPTTSTRPNRRIAQRPGGHRLPMVRPGSDAGALLRAGLHARRGDQLVAATPKDSRQRRMTARNSRSTRTARTVTAAGIDKATHLSPPAVPHSPRRAVAQRRWGDAPSRVRPREAAWGRGLLIAGLMPAPARRSRRRRTVLAARCCRTASGQQWTVTVSLGCVSCPVVPSPAASSRLVPGLRQPGVCWLS
jgi:hypothetical protein